MDALESDDKTFTFEFVKSRCQQEEQRHNQRDKDARIKSETAALLASRESRKVICTHCGKNHESDRCYKKYPHLAPPYWNNTYNNNNKALVGQRQDEHQNEITEECLFGIQEKPHRREEHVCLTNYESNFPVGSSNWFIDFGCTAHMTYDRAAFSTYTSIPNSTVDLGADSRATIVGQGDISLRIIVKEKPVKCTIKDVKHVPTLRYQLLSVTKMGKLGVRASFDDKGATLRKKASGRLIATGSIVNNLYALDVDKPQSIPDKALVASLDLWHQRLAHVNSSGIKSMADRGVVKGIKLNSTNAGHKCNGCILGKGHRTPFPHKSLSRASNVLDLVHSDVLGPLEVDSVGGSKYVITFIDDHSNWVNAQKIGSS